MELNSALGGPQPYLSVLLSAPRTLESEIEAEPPERPASRCMPKASWLSELYLMLDGSATARSIVVLHENAMKNRGSFLATFVAPVTLESALGYE